MAGEAQSGPLAGVSLQGGSVVVEMEGGPSAVRLTKLVTELVERRRRDSGGELDAADGAYLRRVAEELRFAAAILEAGSYTRSLPTTHR